jgi:hypothetical protein
LVYPGPRPRPKQLKSSDNSRAIALSQQDPPHRLPRVGAQLQLQNLNQLKRKRERLCPGRLPFVTQLQCLGFVGWTGTLSLPPGLTDIDRVKQTLGLLPHIPPKATAPNRACQAAPYRLAQPDFPVIQAITASVNQIVALTCSPPLAPYWLASLDKIKTITPSLT